MPRNQQATDINANHAVHDIKQQQEAETCTVLTKYINDINKIREYVARVAAALD